MIQDSSKPHPHVAQSQSLKQPVAPPQPSAMQNPQVPKTTTMPPISTTVIPSSEQLHQTVELAREAQIIQNQILQAEKKINDIKIKAATPGNNPSSFAEEFQEALTKLQALISQAQEKSRQMAILTKSTPPTFKNKVAPTPTNKEDTKLILTSVPNMINGIVTDSLGNYLEGVIVVTHDKQGLPVRALKSNKLGQFLAATPLTNGVYSLTFEKDGLLFDVVEVNLIGKILLPIRVSAKRIGV